MPTSSKKKPIGFFERQKKRYQAFLNRRPHRSFRLTRRRDYIRPLELPGNIRFTAEVTRTIWKYERVFAPLAVLCVILFGLLVGVQSQETYIALTDTLKETGSVIFTGGWDAIGQAAIILLSITSYGLNGESNEVQQFFGLLIILMVWLTTVWLLRNLLAGHKPKLRDGLYNSGAPLFAMIVVVVIIAVQLLPVLIALIGYNAALASGLLAGGASSMLFWIGAALLVVLSLYWITSSLFAMIIVTLPGTYPYQAIKTAGDIIVGRRIKILLRWLWMGLMIALFWVVVMIPIILLDMGLKNLLPAIQWIPIVPLVVMFMTAITFVWISAYVYLLYRKVVDYVPAE